MIAVLVALVFIGIVVAAMLRNTGSQSGASVGYGTMQTMAVTTKSGIVATESYFMNETNAEASLKKIDTLLNDKTKKISLFSNLNRILVLNRNNKSAKVEIGNGTNQYFSSEMDSCKKNGNTLFARFRINSGKSVGGRDLKNAYAFYEMGNVVVKNESTYGAKNAFYSKTSFNYSNGKIDVFGSATFEDDVGFNAMATFHDDVFFNGKVTVNSGAEFGDKVYFNEYAHINAGGTVKFDGNVGINKDFYFSSNNVNVGGNVWINGDFKQETDNSLISNKLNGNNDNHLYYTNKLSLYDGNSCTSTANCELHPNGHFLANAVSSFDKISPTPGPMNVLGSLGLKTLEERRDPQIDISQIDVQPYTPNDMPNSQMYYGHVTIDEVSKLYDTAQKYGRLYDGEYLVIKFNGMPNKTVNFRGDATNTVLNKKVIFLMDGDAEAGGTYFKTTPESSTLIHVAGNAVLTPFKLNGDFHGLIYIDSSNTPPISNPPNPQSDGNKIEVDNSAGGKVVGAIHNFSKTNILFNNNTTVKFDDAALNKFAKLSSDRNIGKDVTAFADSTDKRIRLKPLGYYFY
jgi:hypothetical protein